MKLYHKYISISILLMAAGIHSEPITEKFLAERTWIPEGNALGLYFEAGHGKYRIHSVGPGEAACNGSYKIRRGIVYLQKGKSEERGQDFYCKKTKCIFEKPKNTLYRKERLTCGKYKFWNGASRNITGADLKETSRWAAFQLLVLRKH